MNKLTFLKTMLLAVVLLVASGSAWGQVVVAGWDFNGLSAFGASPLTPTTVNENITIVGLTRGSGITTAPTAAGNAWGGNGVTEISLENAVTGNDFAYFTITPQTGYKVSLSNIVAYNIRRSSSGSTTGQWQYQIGSGLFVNIGSQITWGTGTAAAGNAQPAINLSGIAALQDVEAGTTITLRVVMWGGTGATGSWYFNNFQTGNDLIVYGMVSTVSSSCTASSLAFANATVNKNVSDGTFTITPTTNSTGAITYVSTNTNAATVNETSGLVTLVGAGTTTITASQAADATYCAASVQYNLTVVSSAPTITVTEVTVPAMVALVGNTVTETVNVSGVNLAENLTVSIIGDVDNQFDEPSVTSITKLGDNTATGTVTVTYRPTAAGAHTATLKIESLGATSVTRALSGTGIDPNNPYSLDISSPVSEINETFEAPTAVGFVMPTNWKNVNVVGTKSWEVKLFNANQYAQMSAFSSTSTQQTMLVSPAIDFDQIVKNNITFDWIAGFAKVGTTLKVYTMTLDGIKTEVKSINTNIPTSGYTTVFTTETLDLSSTSGIKFLVFEYNGDGGAAALTTTYQLDNINVQKDLNTGLTNTNNHLEVILVNGNIKFSALAGESVEVYSAVGQKLVQKLTVSGLNSIPVSARGVVLVKVGNRFAKVIL